ncbi:unnamed protein product [Ambrosiozyma monospora]|uniref:Unnamed protein product n=1 Tax=Ambrosiozyma monospora TaxID=43982 RepID=A0A9W6T0Y4_AMBMO|nr:unnamed protein product [Ambrosiozyma monospora]GME70677.1 unnamed protein product [Ambrosiozyma monospora]
MAPQSTAVKFVFGVSLVAIPLFATTYFARPTFANAIRNKLDQEELEKKRRHHFQDDYYAPNERQNEIIKKYLETGEGKAREYKINSGDSV